MLAVGGSSAERLWVADLERLWLWRTWAVYSIGREGMFWLRLREAVITGDLHVPRHEVVQN